MDDSPEPGPAPELRFLKVLVTVLAATMIGGVLLIATLLVIRLRDPGIPLPDAIALPHGAEARAFTQGETWYAVVTSDDEILIYDRLTGDLRQTVTLDK